MKAEYGATLFEDREKFERILGRAVETDLHGTSEVLDLLELLVQSEGKPVRQVPFHVTLLPTFDTATPAQLHEAAQSFLAGTNAISHHSVSQAVHAARAHSHHHAGAPAPSLTPTSEEELQKARAEAPNLAFPLEYPRVRQANAGAAPDLLRRYDIRDQRGHIDPIYAVAIDRGGLGEFYDVQGSAWTDPPLLGDPSEVIHIGARAYSLFYTAEAIRTISWQEHGAVYWIQNTLTNSIQPREMLAMAEQTVPVIGVDAATPTPATTIPQSLAPPPRGVTGTGLKATLAIAISFLSIAALVGLAALLLSRRRLLAQLREQVAHAMALEAQYRPLLATVAVPAVPAATAPAAPTIHTARKRRRRTTVALLGGGALAAALVVVVVIQLSPGGSSQHRPPVETALPVAVFNASGTPGEAHHIAAELRADHIQLGEIGNINANLGSGVHVLYPPHAQAQAQRVAKLISNLSPTVEPTNPRVQGAIAHRNDIVVVFD